MTVRTFAHWWGGQNPTKMGIKIPFENYIFGYSVPAAQYFRDYLFSGTFSNYADAAPRHGVLPYFMDDHYDYPDGWAQYNWKVGMYIPCFWEGKTTSPHMPHFTSRVVDSYCGVTGGPFGSGVSNKLVQIGNMCNIPSDYWGSNTTPQQLFDTVKALRAAIAAEQPVNTPQMTWIGPNIVLAVGGYTGADAWRNGTAWMGTWRSLVSSDPACEPSVYGWVIHANSPTEYNTYFNLVATYMATYAPTKNFRIVEARCGAPDSATQIATMTKALDKMDSNTKCKGTYWGFSSNEFGYANCPWPLANSTGYPPSGHFPWPYALNALGAHWNNQLASRYDIYNPSNAPGTTVQPYPINLPA